MGDNLMGENIERVTPLCELPNFKHTPPPPPKPFPYWPTEISNEELKRGEVMMELNKWANNDQDIAKRTASTLIVLLAKQFEIELKEIT
jgi:hypothetical protein